MNHLLIGGTNDGKRISIQDGRHFVVVKCESGNPWKYGGPSKPLVAETEIYERQFLHGEGRDFEVFAIQGMAGDKMIAQLIDGYKK